MRPDDGSPARLIATMVGIVGILLLGSLAWSAVGALFSALGNVTSSFSPARPTPFSISAVVATPTPGNTPRPTVEPTAATTPERPPFTATAIAEPATPTPAVAPSATPARTGRSPWLLLPQPAPDSRVQPGALTIETRARGDTTISAIRLELDGVALPVTIEQRSESTWRGFATAQVGPGKHTVRATAVDDQNRTGSYRWSFDAAS